MKTPIGTVILSLSKDAYKAKAHLDSARYDKI